MAAAAAAALSSESGSPSRLSTLRPDQKRTGRGVQGGFPTQKKFYRMSRQPGSQLRSSVCPSMARTVQTVTPHIICCAPVPTKKRPCRFPFPRPSSSSNNFDPEGLIIPIWSWLPTTQPPSHELVTD